MLPKYFCIRTNIFIPFVRVIKLVLIGNIRIIVLIADKSLAERVIVRYDL